MRRLVLALMVIGALFAASASPASAATELQVQMTFTEPEFSMNCPFRDRSCGNGVVVPFGHATETIRFEAGCGGACDLRTIDLAEGTLIMEERFSDVSCPGICGPRGNGDPIRVTLTDTIVGGTGVFEGASGTLSGTVRTAGNTSQIKLSGTILLAG